MKPLHIVYAGTPEFAVPALQALLNSSHRVVAVYTQPDRPAGRGRVLTASPVKQCALSHHITVEQPLNFRSETDINHLREYQPDLMIVAAYGLILPQAVLDIPKYGCINIHASLLPRWRGAAPIHRAILAGDKTTGITLMRMEAGLDTGPMLSVCSVEIASKTAAQLHDELATLGATMLMELMKDLPASLRRSTAQPDVGVTYAKKITKDEARIDWNNSAELIDRQVRAFNPWPVAETTLNGKQLRVWKTNVVLQSPADIKASSVNTTSGEVIHVDANGIQVACGAGILNISELQLAGRNVVSASDFIKAHPLLNQLLGRPAT